MKNILSDWKLERLKCKKFYLEFNEISSYGFDFSFDNFKKKWDQDDDFLCFSEIDKEIWIQYNHAFPKNLS